MSNMHIDSNVALEGTVKEIINDLEEHLKAQQEKLRALYKERNFWEAAGSLLDFDQLEVGDFKIVSNQNGPGFKTPSFPIPILSANLFPFSAKYSHPTPPPKSYGQQMNHRRQEDFRYYLEHPEMLATMPGQVFPGVPSMNCAPAPAIAPQETLYPSQMPLTPPQTPPFRQQKILPTPQDFALPPAQAQTQPPVQVSPITVPNQILTQDDLFFIRRMTPYRESMYGLQKKGIHPTGGKRNYKLDPHFWEKNWDGTEDFWTKPSTRKRGRMDDEEEDMDEALSPRSVPRKRVRAAGHV